VKRQREPRSSTGPLSLMRLVEARRPCQRRCPSPGARPRRAGLPVFLSSAGAPRGGRRPRIRVPAPSPRQACVMRSSCSPPGRPSTGSGRRRRRPARCGQGRSGRMPDMPMNRVLAVALEGETRSRSRRWRPLSRCLATMWTCTRSSRSVPSLGKGPLDGGADVGRAVVHAGTGGGTSAGNSSGQPHLEAREELIPPTART